MSKSSSAGFNDDDMNEQNRDILLGLDKKNSKNASQQPKKEEKAQEGAKKRQDKKVSPIVKFFSSIRVFVFLVIIGFVLVFCTAVGVTTMVDVRKVYEKMDILDMKERVQNAVNGFLQGTISVLSRASMLYSDFSYYPYFNNETLANVSQTETYLASIIYYGEKVVVESYGLIDYEYTPFNLIMAWDQDWNERLAYYRPCRDPNNRTMCDLIPSEEVFADLAKGDMTLVHKDEIPKAFRNLNKTKPYCETNNVFNCTGIMNIPFEEGGPMIFSLFNVGDFTSLIRRFGLTYPFDNWTFLVASNALLFNQIEANRTGLCTSFYSSTEKDLPDYINNQIKIKKEKNLVLNPTDFTIDPVIYANVINIDTGEVTLEQDFDAYKKQKYEKMKSDRAVCDGYYDHGDDDYVSMASACLVYKTFNFEKGQIDDETVAFRYEYHAPLTEVHVGNATHIVSALCIVFFLANMCVFVYFNFVFLLPLDRLRKMRGDLIRNTLAGLEDDDLIAKDLFIDMTDDAALIQANGDEISVMLTLQDRLNDLYSNIINSRVSEVNHARSITLKELCALRIMNIFMRREDESLRDILPGLMDPDEVSRRYRRTNIVALDRESELIKELANAKRAFRSLKAVLNNNIATQFFKAFCIKRGRSSVNSFFFLMDVSWLHQVEAGGRSEQDDFLSAMFSDSVSPSPTLSPRSPFLSINKPNDEPGTHSDLLVSPDSSAPDLSLVQPDPDRPHHSHFAKSMSRSSSISSSKPPSPTTSPAIPQKVEEGNQGKQMSVKIPVAKTSTNPPSSPSSPARQANLPQFSSKISEGIAHFIHESYFGRKSLAQRDLRHAALVGCSQVPDYLNLRDRPQDKIAFSPVMFDNLVTAVTKKFTAEVLPQFHHSISFQVMVYALKITGFFSNQDNKSQTKKRDEKEEEQEEIVDENMPLLRDDDLVKNMWIACVNPNRSKKEKTKEDDSSSSSSDSDSSDSEDDSDDSDSDNDDDNDKKPTKPAAEKQKGSAKHDNGKEDDPIPLSKLTES